MVGRVVIDIMGSHTSVNPVIIVPTTAALN